VDLTATQATSKPIGAAQSGADAAKGSRDPRDPSALESVDEYNVLVRDIATVDHEYARWNSAIVERILLAKPSSEEIYLCITPRVLATAFAEAGFDALTPDEAEQRFGAAVGAMYRKRVLNCSSRLRVLRRCGDDGCPDCAAFLAASVLAAYHMQSDEDMSGNAYYKRLADLIGCEMSGTQPVGFSPPIFESLWMFLHNWLHRAHGRRLALPRSDVGLRRFVALPLAHVPLRSLDIEKLPAFFSWAGYEPGRRIQRDQLRTDLRLWHKSKNVLTQTGIEALFDERSEAVLAQVCSELETWDGSFFESAGRRSALVEIQYDVVQRQPMFSYLPRRPSGFPSVFDGGNHVLDASDEGWYDPVPLCPPDGELLASGFEWQAVSNDKQFTLRRPQARVIVLTPSSSYSGFLSSRRLLRGVKCSILCSNDVAGNVQEFVSEIAQERQFAVSHPLLPKGWSIIRDFTAQVHVEAPTEIESLEIDPNIDLLVSGGLRIGRRWSWIAGAPPKMLVTGLAVGEVVKVNGAPVPVSTTGELMIDGLLAEPGEHLIEAGIVRRRIEIVAPQLSVHCPAVQPDGSDRRVKVALPQGSWTLIGASPGEVCRSRGTYLRGTLASCPFEPIWAVQVGAGPGAQVAVLSRPERPIDFDPRGRTRSGRSAPARWANVIYDAAVRRPRFVGMNGMVAVEGTEFAWKLYVAAAKAIKRALKRR
jgi:hypothetical protein